jgi:acyl-CoA reductase-like NAD-dependent aldehyde dehydrogenase
LPPASATSTVPSPRPAKTPGGWSNWEPADRAGVLAQFARQYELVAEDMVRTACQQNGMPISQAAQLEGALPGILPTYYADLIEKIPINETRWSPAGPPEQHDYSAGGTDG